MSVLLKNSSKKLTAVTDVIRSPLVTSGLFSILGIFGIVAVLIAQSFPVITFEAESGTRSGSVSVVGDPLASAGNALNFTSATIPPSTDGWSDTNQPWILKAGESVDDNIPSGVAIKNYNDFTNGGTRTFTQTLDAIRSSATAPYYVRLPAGTYTMTNFNYGNGTTGYGGGYQDVNSTKYFGGFIGAGADKTFIVMAPNSLSSAQLSAITSGLPSPVQVKAIYAGGGGLSIPSFFSGITFRGNFQQTVSLAGLPGTAPAPYNGLFLSGAKAGSMIQYSRFQGFGFTAKNSPPYEMGSIAGLDNIYTIRRTEVDGRLAKEINAAQPVASGGIMWNYDNGAMKIIDSWLHHTRRSGFALHEHDSKNGGNASEVGTYYIENSQFENISDTTDGYAGSSLAFSTSNVEEINKTLTYVKPRFKLSTAPGTNGTSNYGHINLGYSHGNSMADSITVTDPVIGDTVRGGCLIISIVKQPNDAGTSPYYDAYLSGGLGALGITVKKNGVTLTPVLSTAYNAATHTPNKYYVVILR